MNHIAEPAHLEAANKLKALYSTYTESEDLIKIGAYKRGSSKEMDQAMDYYPKINGFLQQHMNEKITFEESVQQLISLLEEGDKT